jgi:hypothetical protein
LTIRRDFINREKYGRTGNAYLHLYTTATGAIKVFSLESKTGLHVGPASMNAKRTELFYTITRELNKTERKSSKETAPFR